jgi:hypothetical protein
MPSSPRPNPFDSIESAQEYIHLLREALDEAYGSIQDDTAEARLVAGGERRVEAFLLVDHKLNQLRRHIVASSVLLNDLRLLRRLLLGERSAAAEADES